MPLARNAAITPVSTSPLPAVASDGGARSHTTGPPPGTDHDRVGALQQDDGRVLLGRTVCGVEPVSVDLGGRLTEQARQLARVRSQHCRRLALDRLEPEERVGVDDRRERRPLEQLPNETRNIGLAPEPGAEGQSIRSVLGGRISSTASRGRSRA